MRLETETDRFYLGRDYSEALQYYGAIPVHIALIPDKNYIERIAGQLDGILLPGSDTDVNPLRFGEEPHPKLKKIIFEKEETDFMLLAEAEKRKIPMFGICFGMQILNVWRGGSLIQDIESTVADCLRHEQGIPLAPGSHTIEIESKSILSSLNKNKTAIVNSHHHQAIDKIGKNLKVSARTKDGIIECLESTNSDNFIMGVQWHPELSAKTDSLSSKLFKYFVNQCINS